MQIEDAFNQFIDTLIINNDNLHNKGLKLYTTVRRHVFYVYKNNNTIFIKPLKGNGHFPQPQKRILDVLNNESTMENRDLQYVKPITEYIQEHYLIK